MSLGFSPHIFSVAYGVTCLFPYFNPLSILIPGFRRRRRDPSTVEVLRPRPQQEEAVGQDQECWKQHLESGNQIIVPFPGL
jgi:hypothetical protein